MRPYREPGKRARTEYLLTDAGRDTLPVLAALTAWGDQYARTSREPAMLLVDEATGQPVNLAFTDTNGTVVDPAHVRMIYGPGATQPTSESPSS